MMEAQAIGRGGGMGPGSLRSGSAWAVMTVMESGGAHPHTCPVRTERAAGVITRGITTDTGTDITKPGRTPGQRKSCPLPPANSRAGT